MTRVALAALFLLGLAGRGWAAIGADDVVPAATLLVPYFEVDAQNGVTTVVTITNVDAAATLAHVTLWTDMAVPAFSWDIYLTGYDQTTIDLRLLFRGGVREVSAPAGADPADEISPKGSLSEDAAFATCAGSLPIQQQMLPAARTALGLAFRGKASTLIGDKCGGLDHGDMIERGFMTIDVTSACTTLVPGDVGYFANGGTGVASNRNVLTGHYELRNDPQNFAQQDPVVHIEASASDPATNHPAAVTFYRSRSGTSVDNRERLSSAWQARYAARQVPAEPAAFPWNTTDLLVWRDPGAAMAPFDCTAVGTGPFPLENPAGVVYDEAGLAMPLASAHSFQLAAERVRVGGSSLPVPVPGGLLLLDLVRQSHVTIVNIAEGRFSTGASAFPVGANL